MPASLGIALLKNCTLHNSTVPSQRGFPRTRLSRPEGPAESSFNGLVGIIPAATPGPYYLSQSSTLHVFKRVIVTPAVYPRLVEFLHFDIQSTGQKSHCVNTVSGRRNALF